MSLVSSLWAASSPGSCVACAAWVQWFPPSFPLTFGGWDLPTELAGVSLISPPDSDKHVSGCFGFVFFFFKLVVV